jgi:hypothetical protein
LLIDEELSADPSRPGLKNRAWGTRRPTDNGGELAAEVEIENSLISA